MQFAAIACAVILSVAAVRPATGATLAGDLHSDNVSLESQLDLGHAGEMAFWGNRAVVALGGDINEPTNDGFALVDITNPARPREISRFMCNSSSFDIAIWEDLVFLAARENVQGTSCDADPVESPDEPLRTCTSSVSCFAGVRIVSIKNPLKPRQIATVSMVNPEKGDIFGPEYITPLPDLVNDRILLYASGTGPPVIIDVPLADPATATQLDTTNAVPASTDCYDVSFYLPGDLAACASFTETVIWDVTDPEKPAPISQIVNPLMDHQIHAAFSWDGDTLIIANEGLVNAFGTMDCDGGTSSPKAALWFYDITTPALPRLRGYFQIPQTSEKFCSVQNFTVVPVPGRDILTAGWYTAGTTIVDFSDLSKPFDEMQIGFYQGPWGSDANRSNVVTAYWYNGHIYAPNWDLLVDTDRSLDVLAVNDPIFDKAISLPYYNFGVQEETKGLTPP